MGDCERNAAAGGSGNDQVPADLPRTPREPGGEARSRAAAKRRRGPGGAGR
jgi:hypothetical protein